MVLAETVGHIYLDELGRAWIDDTRVKVVEIVMDYVTNGWGPEDIHQQYPHISLAQAYAALAYYFEHKEDYDREIEQSATEAQSLRAEQLNSPLRTRLRAKGLIA